MSEDLHDELQAIKSIYGEEVLRKSGDERESIYTLQLIPYHVALRVFFPSTYPKTCLEVLGVESTGDDVRKGYGNEVLALARTILHQIFSPGQVCLFDLLQELELKLTQDATSNEASSIGKSSEENTAGDSESETMTSPTSMQPTFETPAWTMSDAVTEKKSIFLARACPVISVAQVQFSVSHLLVTDKRASRATHNISAYRIRSPASTASSGPSAELTFQDCDDDGEHAAGGRLLHLLQIMDVWGVLVVVSRWYGGIQLGPDRFRLINATARDAIVKGGWTTGSHHQGDFAT